MWLPVMWKKALTLSSDNMRLRMRYRGTIGNFSAARVFPKQEWFSVGEKFLREGIGRRQICCGSADEGRTVVAYSNAVPVVLETEMEKPVLTVNGNVYEGDTKVSLAVSQNGFNPLRQGMIILYKAKENGDADVYGDPFSVGSKSPVISGVNCRNHYYKGFNGRGCDYSLYLLC